MRTANPTATIPSGAQRHQVLFREEAWSESSIQMIGALNGGAATTEVALDGIVTTAKSFRYFPDRPPV